MSGVKLQWDVELARDFVDRLQRDFEHMAPSEARSLRLIEDRYLSTPLSVRAFIHGACGFDPSKDYTMIFFYAIFAGRDVYFDLVYKHEALNAAADAGQPFESEQAAWKEEQRSFWARPEIKALLDAC